MNSTFDPGVRRQLRWWTALLLIFCGGAAWLMLHSLQRTLPYPSDVDEGFVSGPADRMIVEGTLHPYIFNYPSLPKYLAAVGMAGGFLRAASHQEVRDVSQIGTVGYPFYDVPRVVAGAREVFILLAVIALGATGAAAWLAFQTPASILLAPFALMATPLFFYHAWTYLNVDIVGTTFVMLTIVACLRATRRPSIAAAAVVPGALAGLATGSKYTLAFAVLPVLLTCLLYLRPGRRLLACGLALVAMVVAFLLVVPYSVIDIPGFLNGVGAEAYHYAGGHAGADAQPGLQQVVFYGGHFISELGIPGTVLAAIGLGAFAAADWRRTVMIASFPVALLWLLVWQHVHFARNVLSIQPLLAMCLAYGVARAHRWILGTLGRRGWLPPRRVRTASVATAIVLLVAAVPWSHVHAELRDHADSRNLATAWLDAHIEPGWTIVAPPQLAFDARPLEASGRHVKVVDYVSNPTALDTELHALATPAVVLVPQWGFDERHPGQEQAARWNAISKDWRVLASFGANPVLVNYTPPTAWGNPAFSIATLERR